MNYDKLREVTTSALTSLLHEYVNSGGRFSIEGSSIFYDPFIDTVFIGSEFDSDTVESGLQFVVIDREEWLEHFPQDISDIPRALGLLLSVVMSYISDIVKGTKWRVVHAIRDDQLYVVCLDNVSSAKGFAYMWRKCGQGTGDDFSREQAEVLASTYTSMTGDCAVRLDPVVYKV